MDPIPNSRWHMREDADVRDFAGTHLAATDSADTLPLAMNVGTGTGGLVRDVMKLICAMASHSDMVAGMRKRRADSPSFSCADMSRIRSAIGFSSKYSLEAGTKSSLQESIPK